LGVDRRTQRIADERCRPELITHWLEEAGNQLSDDFVEALLDAPYRKKPAKLGKGLTYQDLNVNHLYWQQLEDYYPEADWRDLVQRIVAKSRKLIDRQCTSEKQPSELERTFQLEAISVVILIGS
jgi:hypothetical protein